MSSASAGGSRAGAASGNHLRGHAHLTNCIHLRRHHHLHGGGDAGRSPAGAAAAAAERALMRDLLALQRSRSLRDPSASPRSFLSNAAVGAAGRALPRRSLDSAPAAADPVATPPLKTLLDELEGASINAATAVRRPRRRFRASRVDRKTLERFAAASVHSSSQDAVCREFNFVESLVGAGGDLDAGTAKDSRSVCGIPWNWSRIHHRGKSFLDMAGRSLSCGLSDSKLQSSDVRGGAPRSQGSGPNLPVPSASSTSSSSEALPLLIEESAARCQTRGSFADRYLASVAPDYSGELGIYSNRSLDDEGNSDIVSDARGSAASRRGSRHRSLTQKYAPRTFKDIVGQALVVQALSNAVLRKKIGLVYVFYGPHGTGKTSCAHVFAKALNCHSLEHPKPCDMCSSCVAHNLGKSRNVVEIGPVGCVDLSGVAEVLDNMVLSPSLMQYRVFIIDDCDALPADMWNALSKVIDRAPHRVIFILVSSNLDMPHIILSRCQKFFFPKLKEADIVATLQWISTSEALDVDRDALKLIASQSDGSLRDAEMTLDQLSLLGQRISLSLVQELVGLVSDEKLVDLLDLALSADTVNTVKALREITETGVEPLALMSQLATIITDILAGTYTFTRERLRRKFFKRPTLSKEDMEKLRQALKKLSEAEKQLRISNDKITWLTASLLQLAPEKQYVAPNSSAELSVDHGLLPLNNSSARDMARSTANELNGVFNGHCIRPRDFNQDGQNYNDRDTPDSHAQSTGIRRDKGNMDNEKIWHAVLENIQSDTLRRMLAKEGRLTSVRLGSAPTVQLIFSSNVNKSKAEKFRGQILNAFESVLCSSIILEIRYQPSSDARAAGFDPFVSPPSENGSSNVTLRRSLTKHSTFSTGGENLERKISRGIIVKGGPYNQARWLQSDPHILTEGEIIEIGPPPSVHGNIGANGKGKGTMWEDDDLSSHKMIHMSSENKEQNLRRRSLVRGKVSLAHVINKAEACSHRGRWSGKRALSIEEKLEQENLRLEPRSRTLLCWKVSRAGEKRASWRVRSRRQRSLLKLILCGRCITMRSPR